jgi:hypothetical protein
MLRGINRRAREGVDRRFLPSYSFDPEAPRLTLAQQLTYSQDEIPSLSLKGRRKNIEQQDLPVNVDPAKRNAIKIADLINRTVTLGDNPRARAGTPMDLEDDEPLADVSNDTVAEASKNVERKRTNQQFEEKVMLLIKQQRDESKKESKAVQDALSKIQALPRAASDTKSSSAEITYNIATLQANVANLTKTMQKLKARTSLTERKQDEMRKLQDGIQSHINEIDLKGDKLNKTVEELGALYKAMKEAGAEFKVWTTDMFKKAVSAEEVKTAFGQIRVELNMADQTLQQTVHNHYQQLLSLQVTVSEDRKSSDNTLIALNRAAETLRDNTANIEALQITTNTLASSVMQLEFMRQSQAQLTKENTEALENLKEELGTVGMDNVKVEDFQKLEQQFSLQTTARAQEMDLISTMMNSSRKTETKKFESLADIVQELTRAREAQSSILDSYATQLEAIEQNYGTTLGEVAKLREAAEKQDTAQINADAKRILDAKQFTLDIQTLSAETTAKISKLNSDIHTNNVRMLENHKRETAENIAILTAESRREIKTMIQTDSLSTDRKLQASEALIEQKLLKVAELELKRITDSEVVTKIQQQIVNIDKTLIANDVKLAASAGATTSAGVEIDALKTTIANNVQAYDAKIRTTLASVRFAMIIENCKIKRQAFLAMNQQIIMAIAALASTMTITDFMEVHRWRQAHIGLAPEQLNVEFTALATKEGIYNQDQDRRNRTQFEAYEQISQRAGSVAMINLSRFMAEYTSSTLASEEAFNQSLYNSINYVTDINQELFDNYEQHMSEQATRVQAQLANLSRSKHYDQNAVKRMLEGGNSMVSAKAKRGERQTDPNAPKVQDIRTMELDLLEDNEDVEDSMQLEGPVSDTKQLEGPDRKAQQGPSKRLLMAPASQEYPMTVLGQGVRHTNPALKRKRHQPIYSIRH